MGILVVTIQILRDRRDQLSHIPKAAAADTLVGQFEIKIGSLKIVKDRVWSCINTILSGNSSVSGRRPRRAS